MSNINRQLRGDEGVEPQVYPDSLGYLTIGVGRLVDPRKPGCGLRPAEIDMLLDNDIADRGRALSAALPWFVDLDDARRGVLINMSFQLGTAGLLAFTRTLGLVRAGRYLEAGDAMMQSRWATQTPARAMRLATQMRTGEWLFAPGT